MREQSDVPKTTFSRWQALYSTLCTEADPQPVFDALVQAYTEPHRHYHTLAHIDACLSLFDEIQGLFARPAEAEWALWLHDIVYDPHAHDNEERSAAVSADILRRGAAPEAATERISALVLATRHREIPHDNDTRLLVDIDLSILGAAPEVFDSYEHAIRCEYAWVHEALYREKRSEILEGFLRRKTIYLSEACRGRFEAQARVNLTEAIRRLLHP